MSIKTRLLCHAATLVALAPVAHAQTAAQGSPAATAPAEDTIVVTGIRASLKSSEAIKRNAPQVVDSIVAEDIGKLPDLAVSDSAARIAGVQVYRQGGEAQSVLVRGLPFFSTTYNGREIFTAETRVVALQDFPSANVAALQVFKTSTADLVEPGLAGLVNVQSRKPFDFKGGEIAGSGWAQYGRQSGMWKPNGNFLATKRWDTSIGEIGLLVNASYTELRYRDSEPSNTDFIASPTVNGQQIRLPDIQRLFYRSGDRIRPSVNAAFQWKPTPELEFYTEALWQGFRNRIDDRLVEADLYNPQAYSNLTFRPGTNLVTGGTIVGQPNSLFTFQGGTYNQTDTFQYAGGFKWLHEKLHVTADVARTTSTFRGSTESIDRRFIGTPTTTFDLNKPQFSITGLDQNNPAGFLFQGLYEENQRSAGRGWQGRLDGQYDIDTSFLKNFQIGVRYSDRDATRRFGNRYAFLLPLGLNASTLPVSNAVFSPGFQGTDIQGFRNWSAPDFDSVRSNLVPLRQFIIDNCAAIVARGDLGNGCRNYTTAPVFDPLQYSANEETIAGYAQFNYSVFGDRVDGAVGFRAVHVKTRVTPGAGVTGTLSRPTEVTDWLPNVSARWKIDPKLQLRLSFTQTRTLPNFGDLNPVVSLGPPPNTPDQKGTDSNPYTGAGGNPFLKPFTSDNYDASLEYYFSRTGFVAAAAFHRDLNGFIQNTTFRFTDPTLGVVQLTGPVNTAKGYIDGLELQGQSFLDIASLPKWVRGLGIQGSVTLLDARTQQPNPNGPGLVYDRIVDPLRTGDATTGPSDFIFSIVGLYEQGPFSGRLTWNGRSSYLATRQPRGNDFYKEYGQPADRVDLSLNYNVRENFTLFFDWTNLTNSPFHQHLTSARDGAPRADYIRYIRIDESVISAGLRFRL